MIRAMISGPINGSIEGGYLLNGFLVKQITILKFMLQGFLFMYIDNVLVQSQDLRLTPCYVTEHH